MDSGSEDRQCLGCVTKKHRHKNRRQAASQQGCGEMCLEMAVPVVTEAPWGHRRGCLTCRCHWDVGSLFLGLGCPLGQASRVRDSGSLRVSSVLFCSCSQCRTVGPVSAPQFLGVGCLGTLRPLLSVLPPPTRILGCPVVFPGPLARLKLWAERDAEGQPHAQPSWPQAPMSPPAPWDRPRLSQSTHSPGPGCQWPFRV